LVKVGQSCAAGYSDVELAPLLCAGIIEYRALKPAVLPPGGRLGLYGFGGSAHLAAQVARPCR
jgi:propanol-preferring alcohol dehydrogenase